MIQLTLKPDQHFELTLGTETWRSAHPTSSPEVMQAALAVELACKNPSEDKVFTLWVVNNFATVLFGRLPYADACDVFVKLFDRDHLGKWLQDWADLAIDMAKDIREYIDELPISGALRNIIDTEQVVVPEPRPGGDGHGIA